MWNTGATSTPDSGASGCLAFVIARRVQPSVRSSIFVELWLLTQSMKSFQPCKVGRKPAYACTRRDLKAGPYFSLWQQQSSRLLVPSNNRLLGDSRRERGKVLAYSVDITPKWRWRHGRQLRQIVNDVISGMMSIWIVTFRPMTTTDRWDEGHLRLIRTLDCLTKQKILRLGRNWADHTAAAVVHGRVANNRRSPFRVTIKHFVRAAS